MIKCPMSIFEKKIFENYYTNIFKFILFLSVIILSSAYYIDRILGYDPCVLCIYQRIPYFSIIFLSAIALTFRKFNEIIFYLIILFLFTGFVIASYHSGVERGLWLPAIKCSNEISINSGTDLTVFIEQISNSKMSDCRKPALTIFSLSLAEINAFLNFILIIFMLLNYSRYKRYLNEKT